MKHQRTVPTSESNEQGATPGPTSTPRVPPGEGNAATLSMVLRTLEEMQARMSAMQNTMQKEVADVKETQFTMRKELSDIKETHLSIISSHHLLLNQFGTLQNHKKKFFTRLDIPLEVIARIFAWIPIAKVLKYRRLSKTINQSLLTKHFAVLNMQTVDLKNESYNAWMEGFWIHLPVSYQTVVAGAMSRQLKHIRMERSSKSNAEKKLPESIINLTAVEEVRLSHCKFTGNIPDGIGKLQNLASLNLSHNSLTGMLPSSFNLLSGLQRLDLSFNQLSGEFPALPNLHALEFLQIDSNRFTGPIPTVFGNPRALTWLSASRNLFNAIPATISQLTSMYLLRICENPIASEIPPEIWTLTTLMTLEMSNCKMFGSLVGVGNLHNLEVLDVTNNQLSGELPSREIGSLQKLGFLHLRRNRFSAGEILDMTGTSLTQMCLDPENQEYHVIEEDDYLCQVDYMCDAAHEVFPHIGDS
ncbi:hypothetical protein HDU80_008716 [Chytriomyces hyalinus]|nr:hypothetical protein HDU80_008716 [Chytriomyces hyalinus]